MVAGEVVTVRFVVNEILADQFKLRRIVEGPDANCAIASPFEAIEKIGSTHSAESALGPVRGVEDRNVLLTVES